MDTKRQPRPRRTWVQRTCIFFLIIAFLGSSLSAALLAYAKDTVSSIPRTAFGNILTQETTGTSQTENAEDGEASRPEGTFERETVNFFLIGTDSVASLPLPAAASATCTTREDACPYRSDAASPRGSSPPSSSALS